MQPYFDMEDSHISNSDRIIATPSRLAKKAFYYVQETGYLKSLIPHISRRENIDSYLFIYVMSGKGFLTYNNERTLVNAGTCFFINCKHPYAHESTAAYPWELLWVHFNGSAAPAYYEYFRSNNANIFCMEDSSQIPSLLNQLLDWNKRKPPYHEIISSSLLVQLLTQIITSPKVSQAPLAAADSMEAKLMKIHHYLGEHFHKPLGLEELSEQFFISKYYLCREFKKKYGEGIPSYVTNKRITHAKELLRFTNKSINEISDLCGLNDTNYFIKQFKAAEGITPSAYRKKWVS